MPDDPLSDPPQPRRPKNVTCSFCGSQLDSEGTYVKLGAEAKTFRDTADTIERLKHENKNLDGTVETLRQDIEKLKAPGAPPEPEPIARGFRSLTL